VTLPHPSTTTLTLDRDVLTCHRFGRSTRYALGPGTRSILGLKSSSAPLAALALCDPAGRRLTLHDAWWDPRLLTELASRTSALVLPEHRVRGHSPGPAPEATSCPSRSVGQGGPSRSSPRASSPW